MKLKIFHIFLIIPILYALALTVFPLVYMVVGSFTDWRLGVQGSGFIGLANYEDFLNDYRFYNSLIVTFYLTAMAVPIEILLGLLLAHLMNMKIKFRRLFRTLYLLPLFNAPVAVALMGEIIFYESGGPINGILKLIGLSGVPWRSSPIIAPFTVVLCDIWMWTPFCFLITLAGLESIPPEYKEAALVDGASGFDIFRRINLPLLSRVLITILMFRLLDALKVFEIPFVMVGGGGPGISTESITIYIYKIAFRGFNLGLASAITVVFLVIISIFAGLFLRRVRGYYE